MYFLNTNLSSCNILLASRSSLQYFQVAKTLAKIKGKDSVKDELPQPDHRSLSQIEKDENSLSREELIEHNEAWSAVEKDELFVPEYTKFNSDHINKEVQAVYDVSEFK